MRVNGPYYDARTDTWYLKEFHHAGRGGSRRLTYPTEQAAKKGLAKIEKILARPEETTVQMALDEWIAGRASQVKDTQRLRVLLGDLLAPDRERPVGKLSAERAAALYDRLVHLPVKRGGKKSKKTQRRSDAYHQCALSRAREWGRWLVKQKLTQANPFEHVEPQGRAKAGQESKVWLDPAQLGAWARAAKKAIGEGRYGDGGLAAYLIYALGLRASEPGSMHALRPSSPATEAAPAAPARARFRVKGSARQKIRHLWLALPDWLAPVFETRAAAGARLLKAGRQTVGQAVRALCREAGVPVTCPHGLRESVIDYQAAREAEAGNLDRRMLEHMAALHGHTPKVMERHYMAPGRMEEAAAAQRLRVLQGGKGG